MLVRNRRYAAMQRLKKADYFSVKEMKRREPLMYDELVGKYLGPDEKDEHQLVNKSDLRLSTILLEHFDDCNEKLLKEKQEDEMLEEEEDDDDDEDEEDDTTNSQGEGPLDVGEQQLMKEEFCSSFYSKFMEGKDSDFDYSQVDANEDYDLLDLQGHDEEEKYFDEEEPRSCHTDSEDSCSDGKRFNRSQRDGEDCIDDLPSNCNIDGEDSCFNEEGPSGCDTKEEAERSGEKLHACDSVTYGDSISRNNNGEAECSLLIRKQNEPNTTKKAGLFVYLPGTEQMDCC